MIALDLTTLDELSDDEVQALGPDDFVPVVAALTAAKELRELQTDNGAHRAAFNDGV